MELKSIHEGIIVVIYAFENEGIPRTALLQKHLNYKDQLDKALDELIKSEYIEYEQKNQRYFLCYDTYAVAEEIIEMNETANSMADLEYNYLVRKTRFENIKTVATILIVILVMITIFVGIDIPRNQKSIEDNLTPEMLKTIEQELIKIKDSIENQQ